MEKQIKDFDEYVKLAERTANQQCKNKTDHYILGMLNELGEIAGCLKKEVGYGKKVDVINLGEEIGDFMWFVSQYINECDQLRKNYLIEKINLLINKYGNPSVNDKEDIIYTTDLVYTISRKLNSFITYTTDSVKNTFLMQTVDALLELACEYNLDIYNILYSNIQKLAIRFPDKFTQEQALLRKLNIEYKTLDESLGNKQIVN